MFMSQPMPARGSELAEGVISDAASANISGYPFKDINDWRSFSFELMDTACVPGGVWDIVMGKVYTFNRGRPLKIRQSTVLPIDHVAMTLAGATKLNKPMAVIV